MARKHITADQLGLSKGLANAEEDALFKWLIASFLLGKPIQQHIAEQAYRVIVERHRCNTPHKFASSSKAELVRMLGVAHYVRYDNSTADRLQKLANKLLDEYGGRVTEMYKQSANRQAFEQRLSGFTGVGPRTVEIFMREAGAGLFPPKADDLE